LQAGNDERDLEEISIRHERLIQTILNEEEALINNHRKHIDDTVELTKKVT
jgi:kinesin family protein 2/24